MRLQLASGQQQDLLADPLGGAHHRVAANHGAAATVGADAVGQRLRVAVAHGHALVAHAEDVGGELREDGFHPLADGGYAGVDDDPASAIHEDAGGLPRTEPGLLYDVGEAEADMTSGAAGLPLLRAHRRVTGARECPVEEPREV